MSDTVFTASNRALGTIDQNLRTEGQEFRMPGQGIMTPHYAVKDTALAACLATFEIPFRDPAPFTDDVALDAKGNVTGKTTVWWLGDGAPGDDKTRKTEWLLGAWIERDRFERDHPLHPLVAMRAAIDARAYWCEVIATWSERRAILPTETPRGRACYATDRIHAASVLKACGFAPLAFERRDFFLERTKDGMAAEQLLLSAAMEEGALPQQWMAKVLHNLSTMLKHTKQSSVIIKHNAAPGQTLLLSADSDGKTRDKFHRLLT